MKKLIVLLFALFLLSTPLYAVEYDANADGKIDIGYLPVGTSLQAYDPDLVAIAALTCTENQIIKRNGSGTWICADDSASMTYPVPESPRVLAAHGTPHMPLEREQVA